MEEFSKKISNVEMMDKYLVEAFYSRNEKFQDDWIAKNAEVLSLSYAEFHQVSCLENDRNLNFILL